MKTDQIDVFLASLSRRYALLTLVWSVLVGASLLWTLYQERQAILDQATVATRANIQKDIGFRKWVTSHGGVYVSPSVHTPPNPYLNVPERDVVTSTGKKLTLMNPAYVLRLRPLNPANAPDEWEAKALKSLERGRGEFLEMQHIDGQPYLRMMQPFIVDAGCMKCHAHQGYQIGDVGGGIGSSVPLARFMRHGDEHSMSMLLSHGAIWLIGMAALGFSYRHDLRLAAARQQAQEKLHQQLDELLRWQKLTVGRELRMKELADENAALRDRFAAAPSEESKS
jgi:hypothetical protein